MADRYVVEGWVPPGVQVAERESPTFGGMLVQAKEIADRWPSAVLAFGNADRADLNFDGLTDEEHEIIEAVGL